MYNRLIFLSLLLLWLFTQQLNLSQISSRSYQLILVSSIFLPDLKKSLKNNITFLRHDRELPMVGCKPPEKMYPWHKNSSYYISEPNMEPTKSTLHFKNTGQIPMTSIFVAAIQVSLHGSVNSQGFSFQGKNHTATTQILDSDLEKSDHYIKTRWKWDDCKFSEWTGLWT